ncbi:hypothetical protein [Pseudomonas guariconensis]|uniref:hypothetical protein n=1 Tax=Pseudomonas guariconensis TaxID=1288410 RepID=UPI002119321A|nr:hypothetical protein [Pseudomonas guariconensis]
MAIITTRLERLKRYPFLAIDDDAVEMLCSAASKSREQEGVHPMAAVHLLDCVCHLAGKRLTASTLLSSEAQSLFDLYCSAVYASSLTNFSKVKRQAFCRSIRDTLVELRTIDILLPRIEWFAKRYPEAASQWEKDYSVLDPDKVAYWSGWLVETKNGEIQYLPLENLWLSHGKEFTESFHLGLKIRMEGSAAHVYYIFPIMLRFLEKEQSTWQPDTFHDPLKIHDFFIAFMEYFFRGINHDDPVLDSMKKSWNRFIGQIYRTYIDSRIWCTPFLGLTLADAKALPGNSTHVEKNRDGFSVRTKLVTHIPLHLTEQRAVEQLIITIKSEIQTIRNWATQQTLEITEQFDNRVKLAATAKQLNTQHEKFYKDNFIGNVAAAFDKYSYDLPIADLRLSYIRRTGIDISTVEISKAIGIPTTRNLYPFQCLLILEHPFITNSFLTNFNLLDKNGKQTGIIKEGGKTYLVVGSESNLISGKKPRKGARHQNQKVELSETGASIIADVVKITEPARHYLRSIGSENARKLFIASSYCVNKPIPSLIPRWNKTTINYPSNEILLEQFHPHTELRDDELKEFLTRISPSKIRASRCVEEYLNTGSTELMRQCLGHEKEDITLLESYLPEIFVQFIEGHGIRVLHKAMICHSLKDSPFLVAGANFDSVEILDEFLKNYAITTIPSFLTDPEGEMQNIDPTEDEALVKLNAGSLTALISLEHAVRKSQDQRLVKETAKYWAQLTPLIVKHIEEGTDSVLKQHLKTAKAFAAPSKMEKIIYAKAQ